MLSSIEYADFTNIMRIEILSMIVKTLTDR